MTEELFRQDAYLKECTATVLAAGAEGIVLDRTVFYPTGGGQPGDIGTLQAADGRIVTIADTRKGPDGIRHIPAPGQPELSPGDRVTAAIDWARRHRHMRMHSCLHLLSAVVAGGVTGGQVAADKGRLDFDLAELSLTKEEITAEIAAMIAADRPVAARWISEAELDAQPDLVRTMSVQPPRGAGRIRLIEIEGTDLQPCGGTHVARTGEIGQVLVSKIESKGKRNRRIVISFADAP
ncbi:MAG: alanyl-tRNA editing protein [Thalassobaculales bacterium]